MSVLLLGGLDPDAFQHSRPPVSSLKTLPPRAPVFLILCPRSPHTWERFQLDVTKTGQMFAYNNNDSLNGKRILMETWIRIAKWWQNEKVISKTTSISVIHHQEFNKAAVFRILGIKLCSKFFAHPEGPIWQFSCCEATVHPSTDVPALEFCTVPVGKCLAGVWDVN